MTTFGSATSSSAVPLTAQAHAIPGRPTLLWIDSLRAIAALTIVFYHSFGYALRDRQENASNLGAWGPTVLAFTSVLWAAVPLFFVLSGFCIHLPYANNARPMDWKQFLVRRVVRLYPIYAVAVIVGFGLMRAAGQPTSVVGLAEHLVFWIFGHDLRVSEPLLYGTVIWSIVIELHLYLLYLLAWPLIKRLGVTQVALGLLAFGIAYHLGYALSGQHHQTTAYVLQPRTFALARAGEWMLGAWLAEAYVRGSLARTSWAKSPAVWGSVATLILIVMGLLEHFGRQPSWTFEWLASVGFAFLVGGLIVHEQLDGSPRGWLLGRVLPTIGLRTYTIYMFHTIVIGAVGGVAIRLLHVPLEQKSSIGGSGRWILVTLLGIALLVPAVEILYRLVELPSHRLARRLTRAKATTLVSQ